MLKRAVKTLLLLILVLALLPFVILLVALPFNVRTGSDTDYAASALLAHPPPPLAEPLTLKVVTFNIHDLYVVARDHVERMRAIGEVLTELDADLVGIQEGFVEKHRQVLLDAVAGSRLAYHEYYPSATVGSGKFILSAYPIVEAYFHRFEDSGDWYKVYEGDFWAGKGVALARIELPDNAGHVDFYDTHLQAGYGNPAYRPVRQSQMRGLAGFVNATVTGTAPAFLVGDMNCRPGTEAYGIAIDQAHLERVMAIRSSIDHIFCVRNPRYGFEVMDTVVIDRKIRVGDRETRLSDHTGYMSTIRITPQDES